MILRVMSNVLIKICNYILNRMINKRDKNSSFNTIRQQRLHASWIKRKKKISGVEGHRGKLVMAETCIAKFGHLSFSKLHEFLLISLNINV